MTTESFCILDVQQLPSLSVVSKSSSGWFCGLSDTLQAGEQVLRDGFCREDLEVGRIQPGVSQSGTERAVTVSALVVVS